MSPERITDILAQSVESYLDDAEQNKTLKPYQRPVFGDFIKAFNDGATRCLVEFPTGAGKTVMFVELTKAFSLYKPEGFKPRTLVVTPREHLVVQTLGRNGVRGYGEFAPELRVGSYYGKSSSREKREIDTFDVVVTTYDSLRILELVPVYPEPRPRNSIASYLIKEPSPKEPQSSEGEPPTPEPEGFQPLPAAETPEEEKNQAKFGRATQRDKRSSF